MKFTALTNVSGTAFPVLTLIMLLFCGTARAQANQQWIEQQLPTWLQNSGTPAAGVAFIENDKISWTAVAGQQSEGTLGTEKTLFNAASLAKPVAAEAAMQMIKQKQLGLTDGVTQYWTDPDIKGHEWSEKLTVAHLLSHQSGFPNWRRQTKGKLTFQFEPGSRAGYSGEGFEYLAKVMEQKTTLSFPELVDQFVVRPANMGAAIWSPVSEYAHLMAHPMGPEGKYGEPSTKLSAADDLYISIADYAAFTGFVMQQWLHTKTHERWQIPHYQRQQICQPERLPAEHCPNRIGFALGWSVFEYPSRTLYIQGGGDLGERSMVVISPEDNKAVVVLTNGAGGMKVIARVMDTLLQHPQLNAFIQMQGG